MLEKHLTRDGQTTLIAQMDDAHLCNMIALVLRKAEEVKAQANAPELDAYTRRLYGIPDTSPETAAEATREALRKLYPYLAEAYLRGLDAPRARLVNLLGRDYALSVHPMLTAEYAEYDEEEHYDDDGEVF